MFDRYPTGPHKTTKPISNRFRLQPFHINRLAHPPQIIHSMLCRQGPLAAQDPLIVVSERERTPELEIIRGIQQPFASAAKHLKYWFLGLPEPTYTASLQEMRNRGFIFAPTFEQYVENLTRNAQQTRISTDEFKAIFMLPMLEGVVRQGYITIREGQSIMEDSEREFSADLNLEEGLRVFSQNFLNHFLKKEGLPIIEMSDHSAEIHEEGKLRFIDPTIGSRREFQKMNRRNSSNENNEVVDFLRDLTDSIVALGKATLPYGESPLDSDDLVTPVLYCDGKTIISYAFRFARSTGIDFVAEQLGRNDPEFYENLFSETGFTSEGRIPQAALTITPSNFPLYDHNVSRGLEL